ncbi:6861_t:CDS:1, partial [Funneliformis geosporum]
MTDNKFFNLMGIHFGDIGQPLVLCNNFLIDHDVEESRWDISTLFQVEHLLRAT